jgi:hypothetical protein
MAEARHPNRVLASGTHVGHDQSIAEVCFRAEKCARSSDSDEALLARRDLFKALSQARTLQCLLTIYRRVREVASHQPSAQAAFSASQAEHSILVEVDGAPKAKPKHVVLLAGVGV